MLKLTYTADGLFMEQVAAPLEMLVAQRVMLALRSGHSLYVEPGRASFLMAQATPELAHLQTELQAAGIPDVELTVVDADYLEISLHGHWIANHAAAAEGLFIVALPNRLEFFVHKLWRVMQAQAISAN